MPRGSLSVRINDGLTDRHVTKDVRDLSFRKTAPGGFTAASMRLLLPRSTFADLGPADKVWIYDERTGRTVWEGFTENPGTQDGPGGQGFDLSALGTTILASDESRALVYVDKTLDPWIRSSGIPSTATTEVSGAPDGVTAGDGIKVQFPPGQAISTSNTAQMTYAQLRPMNMGLGAISVTTRSGKSDVGYRVYLRTNNQANTSDEFDIIQTSMSTTAVTTTHWVAGGGAADPSDGQVVAGLALRRIGGATNVADDATWAFFDAISVVGRRVNRTGDLLTGAAGLGSATYVLASWVVKDLIGRVLTMVNPFTSVVDDTSFQIDQLAYPDGVRASDLLDDLALWEPDFLWEMLHSTGDGYVFKYRAWPTTARYEISVKDGYSAPGADIDLCNRIAVYWTDIRGNKQTTIVTASVPALGGAPGDPGARTRDAEPITLPEGKGSAANAQQIGQQILASRANPPKAATAVVRRPITDRITGMGVMPWELEPGYLVRVRETGDLLRLTELEYVDNDVAASLTLGTPQLTIDQRVARLSKVT